MSTCNRMLTNSSKIKVLQKVSFIMKLGIKIFQSFYKDFNLYEITTSNRYDLAIYEGIHKINSFIVTPKSFLRNYTFLLHLSHLATNVALHKAKLMENFLYCCDILFIRRANNK